MRTIGAVVILFAAAAIAVWMVWLAQRDHREIRSSSQPRSVALTIFTKGRIGGVLVGAPLLALAGLDPPARTWVGTTYLLAVIIASTWVLIRRRRRSA